MTRPIQIESRVGADGVLTLRVPLGPEEADAHVRVTVEPLGPSPRSGNGADWHRFVEQPYGSCDGLGLERQPQGDFERREDIE